MNVAAGDESIITYALGSCIGLALYDARTGVAGLAHIMLPDSTDVRGEVNVMKYADTAVPELVRRMERAGAQRFNLVAKMAGGAQMFEVQGTSSLLKIGERNIAATKEALRPLGIRLVAEDTGLNYGRTVELFANGGAFRIKAINKPIKDI